MVLLVSIVMMVWWCLRATAHPQVFLVMYCRVQRKTFESVVSLRRKQVCVCMCVYVCVCVCIHTYIYIYTYVDGCLVRWIVEDDADRSAAATKDIADLQLEDVRVVASSRYEDVLNGCKKNEIK